MGQRLNIEIWDDGKVLANAYYHWSAYTSTAMELTEKILDVIPDADEERTLRDDVQAILFLEETGAGLTDDEKECFLNSNPEVPNIFNDCRGRNVGLIAVSERGIENTRSWEEGRVEIHLDTRTISFDVFLRYSDKQYVADFEGDEDYIKPSELPVLDLDYKNVKFDDFYEFERKIKSMGYNWFKITQEKDMIMCVIE